MKRAAIFCLVFLVLIPSFALAGPPRQRRQARTNKARVAGPIKGQMRPGSAIPWGRPINVKHPLRRQVAPEALLKATLNLAESGELHGQNRHVRKALSKLVKKPQRALLKQKTQAKLLNLLKDKIGEQRYEAIVGTRAAGLKRAAEMLNEKPRLKDREDMQRGWGWSLLAKNDKAFKDPTFLSNILRESGQSGAGHFIGNEPSRAIRRFEEAWSKIAPKNTKPMLFALTGSDANNMLYGIANQVAEQRTRKRVNNAEILFFDGVYGGGRGKIAKTSFLKGGAKGELGDYAITSPHGQTFKPKDRAEIQRLEQLEQKALQEIEHKVANSKKPIGGILVEPILGAKGVLFYRPEFMTKLRTLADRLKIAIFADEILTGGGRTGKFFGYEHYKGFQPDYVTFGKGLQVAGIAQVKREGISMGYRPPDMTTLKVYSEPLLKGAQVMDRVRTGNLMANATKVGSYLVKKLREREGDRFSDRDGPARGMGMLVYTRSYANGVKGAMGRLMPYLSLTRQDVDKMFGPTDKKAHRARIREQHTELDGLGGQVKVARGEWKKSNIDKFDEHYRMAHGGLRQTIEKAGVVLEASGGKGKLAERAKLIVTDARKALDELNLNYAERNLASWQKNGKFHVEARMALRHATDVMTKPGAPLSAQMKARATKTAIAGYSQFVEHDLKQANIQIKAKNWDKARHHLESARATPVRFRSRPLDMVWDRPGSNLWLAVSDPTLEEGELLVRGRVEDESLISTPLELDHPPETVHLLEARGLAVVTHAAAAGLITVVPISEMERGNARVRCQSSRIRSSVTMVPG